MKIEKTPELTELLQKLNHYQREWMVFRKAFLDEDIKQVMAAPPAASINLNLLLESEFDPISCREIAAHYFSIRFSQLTKEEYEYLVELKFQNGPGGEPFDSVNDRYQNIVLKQFPEFAREMERDVSDVESKIVEYIK